MKRAWKNDSNEIEWIQQAAQFSKRNCFAKINIVATAFPQATVSLIIMKQAVKDSMYLFSTTNVLFRYLV